MRLPVFTYQFRFILSFRFFFFFNDTATTEIYTLSLHDALPISAADRHEARLLRRPRRQPRGRAEISPRHRADPRSEEHTSELQSLAYLVCRLLLEKKNKITFTTYYIQYAHHDLTPFTPFMLLWC